MSTASRRNFLKSIGVVGGGLTFGWSLFTNKLYAGGGEIGLPYYKQGAPFLQDLRKGLGKSFTLQGIVFQSDGKTPLEDAVVEIWHCDENGHFDFSNNYNYRGKTRTDKKGRYRIKTHFPGQYKEKDHSKMSRVFVLVNGPGHKECFSQLYFDHKHNPYIDNSHWAACPMAERPSLPKMSQSKNKTFVTYNHYLNKFALLQVASPKEIAESCVRIYPNHLKKQYYLTFGKSHPGHVVVRLSDKKNQVVQKHFFKHVRPEQELAIGIKNLPAGIYTCFIYSSRFGDFKRNLKVG